MPDLHGEWPHLLEGWHEFYLLIGTARLTLSGLLFVVVSFGARTVADQAATGVRAFVSPNAVYFTVTLVVAAVLLIPDDSRLLIGALSCVGALASLAYLASAKVHRLWRVNKLGALDWVWLFRAARPELCGVASLRHRRTAPGRFVSIRHRLHGPPVDRHRRAQRLGSVLWMAEREHG